MTRDRVDRRRDIGGTAVYPTEGFHVAAALAQAAACFKQIGISRRTDSEAVFRPPQVSSQILFVDVEPCDEGVRRRVVEHVNHLLILGFHVNPDVAVGLYTQPEELSTREADIG